MHTVNTLIVAVGAVALALLSLLMQEEACSWGWLQYAGTTLITALIGAAMCRAIVQLSKGNHHEQ